MNKHASYQQLRGHVAYLKLAAAAEHLPAALEAAEQDTPGYTQFLHDLLDVEVTATEQRRLAGRLGLKAVHAGYRVYYTTAADLVARTAASPPGGEIFEDTTVAAAILDRLLHHATVRQIDGDSYAVRGHRARLQQLRTGLDAR